MTVAPNRRWLLVVMAPILLGLVQVATTPAEEPGGMVLVAARCVTVGTSEVERKEIAKRFDCHPTWLGDDLPRHEVAIPTCWIDRHPVTNAQYLRFIEATGHPRPDRWGRWGGAFPTEYGNHPVGGVGGKDAVAYARWAGKRLRERGRVGGGNRRSQSRLVRLGRGMAGTAGTRVPGARLLGVARHEADRYGGLRSKLGRGGGLCRSGLGVGSRGITIGQTCLKSCMRTALPTVKSTPRVSLSSTRSNWHRKSNGLRITSASMGRSCQRRDSNHETE